MLSQIYLHGNFKTVIGKFLLPYDSRTVSIILVQSTLSLEEDVKIDGWLYSSDSP